MTGGIPGVTIVSVVPGDAAVAGVRGVATLDAAVAGESDAFDVESSGADDAVGDEAADTGEAGVADAAVAPLADDAGRLADDAAEGGTTDASDRGDADATVAAAVADEPGVAVLTGVTRVAGVADAAVEAVIPETSHHQMSSQMLL